MKALTLHQPWATLVALGVKTIETRSWPAPKALIGQHIAIHAGLAMDHGKKFDLDAVWRDHGFCFTDYERFPLGCIVATARLVDCVPMMSADEKMPPGWDKPGDVLFVGRGNIDGTYRLWLDNSFEVDRSDQLPYGDFTPGRWAWLLDDVKPTTERCPACMGARGTSGSIPYEVARWRTPCATCEGAGFCPPIPAKGKQRVWEWTP